MNPNDWSRFHLSGRQEGQVVHRSREGTITPHLNLLNISGADLEAFATWLRTPRPILPGDFVASQGRYRNDASEVLAIVGDRAWIHAVWATSSEHSIEHVATLGRISEEAAVKMGFRLSERLIDPEDPA